MQIGCAFDAKIERVWVFYDFFYSLILMRSSVARGMINNFTINLSTAHDSLKITIITQ